LIYLADTGILPLKDAAVQFVLSHIDIFSTSSSVVRFLLLLLEQIVWFTAYWTCTNSFIYTHLFPL